MKKAVKALWLVYAVVLCFGFFQTTASVSALLGFSEGQYILLNGGLAVLFVLLAVLPVRIASERHHSRSMGASRVGAWKRVFLPYKNRMHGRRRGGVRPAAACATACCLVSVLTVVRVFRIPDGILYVEGHSREVFLMNLICQAVGSLLIFAALFFLSGFWSAVFMMIGTIAFSPLSEAVYAADPQNQLFLLTGAELLGIVSVCRGVKRPCGRRKTVFITAAGGLFCGLLCLADLRLCAFLLLPAGEALWDGGRGADKGVRCVSGQRFGFRFFLAAAAVGFLSGAAVLCLSFGSVQGFENEMAAFLSSWFFMTGTRTFPVMLHSPLLSEYIAALFCYLSAFLPLFFERARRTPGTVRWILPFAAVFAAEQAAFTGLQGQALRFTVLSAMAGAAVTGIFGCREPAAIGVTMKRRKTDLEKSDTSLSPAPGEYLDNPLPVPKRHTRKEMNYGFEPVPEQMYYEIPVADNDDFDV